jgi:hypothetical protein
MEKIPIIPVADIELNVIHETIIAIDGHGYR